MSIANELKEIDITKAKINHAITKQGGNLEGKTFREYVDIINDFEVDNTSELPSIPPDVED